MLDTKDAVFIAAGSLAVAFTSLFVSAFNAYNSFNTERKNRRSEVLKNLMTLCKEIELEAKSYWITTEVDARDRGMNLISQLRMLAMEVKRSKCILWDTVDEDVLKLKQACTGGNFQVTNRPAYLLTSAEINQIQQTAHTFIGKVNVKLSRLSPIK